MAVESTASAARKLLSKEVSYQADKLGMPATGEFMVRFCAVCNLEALTNLLPWVTPATRIPMIKSTIETSISEKAF